MGITHSVTNTSNLLQRNAGLDYLRAAAIVIVLANHALLGFFISTGQYSWSGLLAKISIQSVIAIEWLFVLSGYLIGMMMIRSFSHQTSWMKRSRDFWLRRWFRTIPNYYLFLLINLSLISIGVGEGSFEWSFLFFSQNLWSADTSDNFFSESWSLALDEWFYLVMPILLGIFMLIKKFRLEGAFFATSIFLISTPLLARLIHSPPSDVWEWDAAIRRVTLYHLDATGWGVMAAAVNRWHKSWWSSSVNIKALLGLGLTCLGMFSLWILVESGSWGQGISARFINSLSLTAIGCGTFFLLPWLTGIHEFNNILKPLIHRLSLYSYSIYLAHMPVLFIVLALVRLDSQSSLVFIWSALMLWLVLVYIVSALVYHYFEWPISKLRERFTQRVSSLPF